MNKEPTTHCPLCGKAKRRRGVYCKPCGFIARRPANRAWAKANYDANPRAKLEKVRKWRETNPEKCAKGARDSYAKNAAKYKSRFKDYYRKNPAKKKATALVNNIIVSGKLMRQPCQVCGEVKAQAHHDSYAKECWLDVRWLCRKHHMAWHRVFLPELSSDV